MRERGRAAGHRSSSDAPPRPPCLGLFRLFERCFAAPRMCPDFFACRGGWRGIGAKRGAACSRAPASSRTTSPRHGNSPECHAADIDRYGIIGAHGAVRIPGDPITGRMRLLAPATAVLIRRRRPHRRLRPHPLEHRTQRRIAIYGLDADPDTEGIEAEAGRFARDSLILPQDRLNFCAEDRFMPSSVKKLAQSEPLHSARGARAMSERLRLRNIRCEKPRARHAEQEDSRRES